MTKERPIIFSGAMVRAILEGRKTQTRRVVKQKYALEWLNDAGMNPEFVAEPLNQLSPYGYAGDRLWVRETWSFYRPFAGDATEKVIYRADGDHCGQYPLRLDNEVIFVNHRDKWTPSIHMPRWASRINLEVTDLRIERLQDISDSDCEAEGVRPSIDGDARDWRQDESGWRRTYRQLWDSINRKFSWDSNPFVWVVGFKKL